MVFSILCLVFAGHVEAVLIGKINLAEGRADVLKAGTKTIQQVKKNDPVDIGDIYRVKSDGRVEITFFDGGAIRIAPGSRCEIKDYSSDTNKTNNIIRLSSGHVQVISGKTFIQKVSQYIEGNRFEVHTPNAVAGVRGSNMVVSFIRSVTTTLFIDGKGYQYNPTDPGGTRVTIVKGEISFVAAPTAPPSPPRKATPSETNQIVKTVTVTPKALTTASSSGSASGAGGGSSGSSQSGSGSSGASGTPTTGSDTAQAVSSVSSASASSFLAATLAATTDSLATISTQTAVTTDYLITIPTLATATVTVVPVIPVTITDTTVTATAVSETVQPGFSGSFTGVLFKTFSGTKGRGNASGNAYYDYTYVKTSASRLGYGEVSYDSYVSYNVITGNGSVDVVSPSYGYSSGANYYPDGTYIKHSQTTRTRVTSRGTWDLSYDVSSMATAPTGYTLSLAACMTGNTLELNGTSTGTISSSQLSWDSAFGVTISGNYSVTDTTSAANVVRAQVSGTTTDGGAYSMLAGGVISSYTSTAGGLMYGIAIDPSNRGLVWAGNYSGSYDSSTSIWTGSGTVTPVVMNASPGIGASSLSSYLDYGFIETNLGAYYGSASGEFGAKGWGQTLSILGQPWGIYYATLGIDSWYYNPSSATTFQAGLRGWGEFGSYQDTSGTWQKNIGFYIAGITGGTDTLVSSNGGKVAGDVLGTYWTYTGMGSITGKLTGGYGTSTSAFYGTSAGYWQKTRDFSFAGSIDRAGARRYVAWASGEYNYTDGSWFRYCYARDAQLGNTNYETSGGQLIRRYYKPDRYGQYSSYEEETITGTTASVVKGSYASDISSISSLAPGGYNRSSGPDYSYSFATDSSSSTGIMGGVGNLWAATSSSPVSVYFAGEYSSVYSTDRLPYLYTARISSYNPYLDNGTTAIGGAYNGVVTAIMDQGNGNVESGHLTLLYINNGMAGIIRGVFSGSVDSYVKYWQASGTAYPVDIMATSITPENLSANIKTTAYQLSVDSGSTFTTSTSGFWDGSAYTGSITVREMDLRSMWIDGMAWGITRTMFGGTYTGTTSNIWRNTFEWENTTGGGGMHELIGRAMYGTTWSGDRFSGSMAGYRGWISASDAGVNISFSNLAGTFNPAVMTWQAIGTGVWMGVNQFLALQGTSSGQEILQKLNIPCVEVGSVTLTGSGNGFTSFAINDAKFFSTASGGSPMIWASNNIAGTYSSTGSPAAGGYTALTGGGGSVTASVQLKQWDTTNNKWLAGVNGSGTLSGGSYSGSVSFKGAAAGNISSKSLSITGVAGGVARK